MCSYPCVPFFVAKSGHFGSFLGSFLGRYKFQSNTFFQECIGCETRPKEMSCILEWSPQNSLSNQCFSFHLTLRVAQFMGVFRLIWSIFNSVNENSKVTPMLQNERGKKSQRRWKFCKSLSNKNVHTPDINFPHFFYNSPAIFPKAYEFNSPCFLVDLKAFILAIFFLKRERSRR